MAPTPAYVEVSPDSSAERELIRVMLLHPDQVDRIIEEVSRIDIDDAVAGALPDAEPEGDVGPPGVMRDPVYAQIFQVITSAGGSSVEAIAERLGEIENHVVEQLRAEPDAVVDAGRTIADSIRMLRARALRERLDEHARMLPLAEEPDKPELLRREAALRRELAAVGGREWRMVRKLG